MRIIRACLLSLTIFLSFAARAEPPLGAVTLHQAVLDLGTDLRLMCVAAHPDDEDGASLAMYRKKWGYKTFAVLATRGEGGQNEIGPELYEELALLRTHEMAAAAKITGSELHFLNLPEFGYSKSREETYSVWGENVALERMVRKIRELRPDVIITNHGPQGGHGHHQAIGHALHEAFDLAADESAFPEHMDEGLEPWQAARLYLRSFRGGDGSARINYGELDPVRGYSYAEIAAQALREHKSQGMGFFIDRFLTTRSSTSYRLVKEAKGGVQGAGKVDAPGGDLFAGLKDRVSREDRRLSEAGSESGRPDVALRRLAASGDDSETARARANALAVAATELRIRARVDDALVVPGQEITVSVEVMDYGIKEGESISFALEPSSWFPAGVSEAIEANFSAEGFATAELTAKVPENQPKTIPHKDYVFAPHFLEAQLTVVARADAGGVPVELRAPILLDVAPTVGIEIAGAPYLVGPGGNNGTTLKMLVTNYAPNANEVSIQMSSDAGFIMRPDRYTVTFAAEGDQKIVPVRADLADGLPSGDYHRTATIVETGYKAQTTVRLVDMKVPRGKNVGVISSYDDTFMNTLARLDVPHAALQVEDYVPERLDEFTTIIVDIRAYLVRPDLVANNQALLDYVHRGGTLIVMYQKTFEWDAKYAPYELRVGRGRVTVEDAPIEILVPDHPLFNSPNTIVDSDWEGWRQERGLYFPSRWAEEYTALIHVADPGESLPPGSCLIADYGEGTYLYTALVWYRQLRDLNPGALRVFANMLAL